MIFHMLKCKIHRAMVTEADLDYEGSISIDQELRERAGLLPYEKVEIYNITNGNRFSTYVIDADRGSATIGINGAAAHLASPGDRIIICAYVDLDESEIAHFLPTILLVDDTNQIKHIKQRESHGQFAA